jgi:hypothetical protein
MELTETILSRIMLPIDGKTLTHVKAMSVMAFDGFGCFYCNEFFERS